MNEISIYIHIPFCQKKCNYCDFNSFSDCLDIVPDYISYLKREIDLYRNVLKNYEIKTIFFGGGTPSLIDAKYIAETLKYIYNNFNISHLKEITLEANPKTLNSEKLKIYKDIGINRISLGVQTLNDKLLKRLGRIHDSKIFYKNYEEVRKHGFKNVNVDVMFNLPNQGIDDVLETLNKLVKLNPEHISYYSLTLEKNTPFYNDYKNNKLHLPDEDTERLMYHKGLEFLQKKRYVHYEISNLAKEGYQCFHNLVYWKVKPYIGLGLSAHSNINGVRYGNYDDFKNYFSSIENGKLPFKEMEFIDKKMEMSEFTILGLRLIDGISYEDFYKRFNCSLDNVFGDILNKYVNEGLIKTEDKRVKLTNKGLDLCNQIFVDLLP